MRAVYAQPEATEGEPTTAARVSVVVVDDQPAFRDVARRLVDATAGMELAGEADCGERAVELVESLAPDLVLMDVCMPGLDGVAATRRIKAERPGTVVVLVSTTAPEDLRRDAGECSAEALVWKANLTPALLREIWLRSAPSEPAAP